MLIRLQNVSSLCQAAKKHNEKARIDAQTKQMGNNLHDRAASPDDPDSKRPDLARQEGQRELPVRVCACLYVCICLSLCGFVCLFVSMSLFVWITRVYE